MHATKVLSETTPAEKQLAGTRPPETILAEAYEWGGEEGGGVDGQTEEGKMDRTLVFSETVRSERKLFGDRTLRAKTQKGSTRKEKTQRGDTLSERRSLRKLGRRTFTDNALEYEYEPHSQARIGEQVQTPTHKRGLGNK